MMKNFGVLSRIKLAFVGLLALMFLSCNKETLYINLPMYGPEQVFYALNSTNLLTAYNAKDVRNSQASVNISGLAPSETILAIDFRPATGELYGVSSLSKLYIIDLITGIARAVSTTAFTPTITRSQISIDFNPAVDLLRIVNNKGQNLRLNPQNGEVVSTDSDLPSTTVSGIAYTNSFAGATSTVLYDIDATAGKLFKQDPPNNGTLVPVGNLEENLGENVSFDISPNGTNALAVGKTGDSTKLYTISLTNGKATLAGKFPLGTDIQNIAIPADPVAYAVTPTNNLLIFNPTLKTTLVYNKAISGLQAGETIYGIDMRPVNGQLYALGSSNRLYSLNMGTGAATQVGTNTLNIALNGTSFGFDFNPITDLIHVVSDTRQHLTINPSTAEVLLVAPIAGSTATVSASAFNNNQSTATATTLFAIDHSTAKLYSLLSTTGALTELGELKLNFAKANGFDVSVSNVGYGIFAVGAKTSLYTVDLSNGLAALQFDLTGPITGFTLGFRF